MPPVSPNFHREFLTRHRLRDSQFVQAESKAIHWTSAANVLINQRYSELPEDMYAKFPAIGFILNLLHRAFEHLDAALVAFTTHSGASSEGLSRVAVELSVSIRYILAGQPESRLLAFFVAYLGSEEKRLRNWERSVDALPDAEKSVHAQTITHRGNGVAALKTIVTHLQQEFRQAGIALVSDSWPSVADRFDGIGDSPGYRTIYSRMSSQVHSDAEETIRYFMMQTVPADLRERMAVETIAFSRFMLYFGVRYFIQASAAYAKHYGMDEECRMLERGLDVINEELKAIAPLVD